MSSDPTVGRQRDNRSGGRSDEASPRAGLLPTKRTSKKTLLEDLTIAIYGPSKIGKTTWCSQAKDALFLATEPGLNALEVYQVAITSWPQFLEVCAEIEVGDHPFRVVVIDTIDNLHKLAAEHIRHKLGIDHEADAAYGKGFGLVNDELHRTLTKLAFLPYGLILVSHSEEREIPTRTGKVTRIVPSLPDKTRRIMLALVDMILFADFEERRDASGHLQTQRVVRTRPTPRYEAGDRTGLLPEVLPLDFAAFTEALKKGAQND
jgi:hypothetical protein